MSSGTVPGCDSPERNDPLMKREGEVPTAYRVSTIDTETEEREPGIIGGMITFVRELFSKCPPGIRRRRKPDGPFLVIAHRGSPTREPENTIPSFELAMREGANALELDLSITKDGEVVLWHDWDPDDFITTIRQQGLEPTVRYTTYGPDDSNCRRPVCELTLKELRDWYGYCVKSSFEPVRCHIPTFDEFIDWCVGCRHTVRALFLDVKLPEEYIDLLPAFMKRVASGLQRCDPGTAIIFESTSARVIEEMRSFYPSARYAHHTEFPFGLILFPSRHSAVKEAERMGNRYAIALRPRSVTLAPWVTYRRLIAYDLRYMGKRKRQGKSRKKRGNVKGLIAATINDPREMECLVKLGVDGIQTDLPGELRRVVEGVMGSVEGEQSGLSDQP